MVEQAKYNDYYKQKKVQFELVKNMKGREVSLLGEGVPVRCIKAHNIGYLNSNFKAFRFFNTQYNIYSSLALLNNMPMFSYSPKTRRDQQDKFIIEFENYVTSYDVAFDFDSHHYTIEKCYNDVDKFCRMLTNSDVSFNLKSSGSGFHIGIFPTTCREEVSGTIDFLKNSISVLKQVYRLDSLDSSVYDIRRLWKIPYSLDIRSGNVALPFLNLGKAQ